jgi:hypothetical protein
MEIDWEFEVGGGAPVIDALWPGFVDLRREPQRIGEIEEAAGFPALAQLLATLNGPASTLWTAKCDLWEPEESEEAVALACYVDLLPLSGRVFAQPADAEAFCREWVARLAPLELPQSRVDLVVRLAIAGEAEGLGVTAYFSARGADRTAARAALSAALMVWADAIPAGEPPAKADCKIQ